MAKRSVAQPRSLRTSAAGLPVGRPLRSSKVYVVDEHCEPVPIGIPGELYVGGEGVARGYLDRPEATAERFVPDPFAEVPGARLYRTGDRARYLPDGNVEFLGRVDQQVKIRGFRIELGEIESVLAQHDSVRNAVVLAREDGSRARRLVAYVVPDGQPSIRELRDFIRDRLPDYMTPAAFVMLKRLPLTRNGKVDRDALPSPE